MTKTQSVTMQRERRPLAELNLIDDFLFQQMLSQEEGEEFCRILLSTILGKQIRKVRVIPQKNVPGIDTGKHGIRMDAYIEDVSEKMTSEMIDAEVIPDWFLRRILLQG